MKIYIIKGIISGDDWDDEWNIKAFKTIEKAKEYLEKLEQINDELYSKADVKDDGFGGKIYSGKIMWDLENKKFPNMFDPNGKFDYHGTFYDIFELELED